MRPFRLYVLTRPLTEAHGRLLLSSYRRHCAPHLSALFDRAEDEGREPAAAEIEAARLADIPVQTEIARMRTAVEGCGPAYDEATAAAAAAYGIPEAEVRTRGLVVAAGMQIAHLAPRLTLRDAADYGDDDPILSVVEEIVVIDDTLISAVVAGLPDQGGEDGVASRPQALAFLAMHRGAKSVIVYA